jgi:hypothetical protein
VVLARAFLERRISLIHCQFRQSMELPALLAHLVSMESNAHAASHDSAARWVGAAVFVLWMAISVGVAMAE